MKKPGIHFFYARSRLGLGRMGDLSYWKGLKSVTINHVSGVIRDTAVIKTYR